MQINYIDLGQRIKEARKHVNMTQAQLAEKIGVGVTHVSHIETGATIPSLKVIISIMNELGLSPNELFYGHADTVEPVLKGEIAAATADCSVHELRMIARIISFAKALMRDDGQRP